MIAGVALGPSLLGVLWPGGQQWLFPTGSGSMSVLHVVSQIGLVLYMFCVGMELRTELLRERWRTAAAVSSAGIVVPFALGGCLAALLGGDRELFGLGTSRLDAILFLGAAMSITAFPMLARIIHERGLSGTSVGTLALAAGAINDLAAWGILSLLLASFVGEPRIAFLAIGGAVAYVLVMTVAGKRLLARLEPLAAKRGASSPQVLSVSLVLLAVASWYTDAIGMHAVFGAFVLGAVIPRGAVAKDLVRVLEPVTANLLLPLFFVYCGLNTKIQLIDTPSLWLIALAVLGAACLGKGVACWAAARWNGETQRDALAVGALMNARGLMELIILNIGLSHGIITTELFSIMVIMTIVTTLGAVPAFELSRRGLDPRAGHVRAEPRRR